jgi:HPt (histidine-containing phosphotransfer) domain-containing protein
MKTAQTEIEHSSRLWNEEEALQRLGGNCSLLVTIANMFLTQIEQKTTALNTAVSQQDVESIRFTSHTIKGASGDIGATALHSVAARIEQLAKANELDSIHEQMAVFDKTVTATVQTIEQKLPALTSASS